MTTAEAEQDRERIINALIYIQGEAEAAGLDHINWGLKRLLLKAMSDGDVADPTSDDAHPEARFLLQFALCSRETQRKFLAAVEPAFGGKDSGARGLGAYWDVYWD